MEYEPLEIIGHGSFGLIRKVKRVSDGALFARKEVSYRQMKPKERNQLKAEFRILKSLDHPNIVKYLHHDHLDNSYELHLYMEYCGGGDLSAVIRLHRDNQARIPEYTIWNIFVQLTLALYRCHYNSDAPQLLSPLDQFNEEPISSTFILHRDIKPENIFIDKGINVKLGDFGLAKLLDGDNPLANTYVGTPYYMAPEVLMDHPSTPYSDIWSLGCVIYELCTWSPPFKAKSHLQLTQMVRNGKYPPIPDYYSFGLRETVAMCLNIDPHMRPTTAVLLNLDILKIFRKERELVAREEKLALRERQYQEIVRKHLEHELEDRLEQVIEKEVEARLKERIAEQRVRGPRDLKMRFSLDNVINVDRIQE